MLATALSDKHKRKVVAQSAPQGKAGQSGLQAVADQSGPAQRLSVLNTGASASPFVRQLQKYQNMANTRVGQSVNAAIVQREKFDVGTGAAWHIHYGHVKFGKLTKQTRIEFNDRTAAAILQELADKLLRYGLGHLTGKDGYADCVSYINDNY